MSQQYFISHKKSLLRDSSFLNALLHSLKVSILSRLPYDWDLNWETEKEREREKEREKERGREESRQSTEGIVALLRNEEETFFSLSRRRRSRRSQQQLEKQVCRGWTARWCELSERKKSPPTETSVDFEQKLFVLPRCDFVLGNFDFYHLMMLDDSIIYW